VVGLQSSSGSAGNPMIQPTLNPVSGAAIRPWTTPARQQRRRRRRPPLIGRRPDWIHPRSGPEGNRRQGALDRSSPLPTSPRRWPAAAATMERDLMDTDDLVQETVIRTVKRIEAFEPRHEGPPGLPPPGVMNRIRDEIRRSARSPVSTGLDDNEQDRTASPLDEAIGSRRWNGTKRRCPPQAEIVRQWWRASRWMAPTRPWPRRSASRPPTRPDGGQRALLRLAQEMSLGV